jgi:NAD(P)-dependent dehydrogenase (short-subunit alcohol dehydrogenase family)
MEKNVTDYAGLFRLDGRQALVVGAGSGIGRETALALAAHGAQVVCADRDGGSAEQTAGLIGARARSEVLDVGDFAAIRQTADALDHVEILAFTPATNVRRRIVDYTDEEIDRVIALNLRASFELVRVFGAAMASRGRGSIVAFSSIRAATVEPGQSVYAMTKAGLEALVRAAATEFGPCGVRVNAIRPGVVETPLTAQIRSQPDWYDAYASKSVLGRWAKAGELAGAVVFLASDAGSFVTGSTLTVDGGWTAQDGRFDPPLEVI